MLMHNVHIKLIGTISLCAGMVVILFLSSERQVHRNNAFTRRYPPHPVIKQYDLDIGYNSYYIAGFDNYLLYLGNHTAPWHLLQVHLGTQDTVHIRMEPIDKELRYRSLETKVLPPHFFVMDGTMPFILRGRTDSWKAWPWMEGTAYFTKAIPIDSNKVFVRTVSARTRKTILGLIEKTRSFKILLDTTLLEAQIDGVFDVDGELVRGGDGKRVGYVYYYRNQFITMGTDLKDDKRHRTIDTVQHAQLQLATANKKGQIQMQAPPLTINKTACMNTNLMLIRSDRLGRNESRDMLDKAAIIDVYNHQKNTYDFSFYLYDINKQKAREFVLHGNHMVALIGDRLSVYRTVGTYFDRTATKSTKETTGP